MVHKKSFFTPFSLFTVLSAGLFISQVYADTIPNIIWLKQEKFAWCWAASSHVILNYLIQNFSKTQAQIAATISNNTSSSGDTVPREKIPECIILSSKPTPTSAPLLAAKFVNRPLTFTEMKERVTKKLPFTVMYDYSIHPYYHCVVYAGFLGDSTKNKLIDPDRLRNSAKFYYNSYTEMIKGAPGYKDLWEASIVVDPATSIEESIVSMNKFSADMELFFKKKGSKSFSIVYSNQNENTYTLNIFNARGMSVYHTIINPKVSNEIAPLLAPGMYTLQTKPINKNACTSVKNKSFIILY